MREEVGAGGAGNPEKEEGVRQNENGKIIADFGEYRHGEFGPRFCCHAGKIWRDNGYDRRFSWKQGV